MTLIGQIRIAYRAIETPPSRFSLDGAYRAWCARAARWWASR